MKNHLQSYVSFIGLFIFGLINTLNAQCLGDQSQVISNGGLSARNLVGSYEAQTFTAGVTGQLCEIDMMMFGTMSGNGTMRIYAGAGISGSLIASQPVYVNVPSGQVWQNWSISSPPIVSMGSVYTFQFIPTQGGGLPDPYGILVTTNNEYSGGYWLSNPAGDLTFRTMVIPLSINASIFANSPTTFCQGDSAVLTANQQGSIYTYQWLQNNLEISGAIDANYTATTSGNYSVIIDSLGAYDTSNVISVIVNPLPSASIDALPAFINYYAPSFNLSATPIGGSFLIDGSAGNNFNPLIEGLGNHIVQYNYMDGNGCSDSAISSTIVYDTLGTVCTLYDTVLISVTDTLIIDAVLTGLMPPNNVNTIKIYPNPASTYLYIDNGDYMSMNGYSIRIDNSLSQTVFSSPINQAVFSIDLDSWSGYGLYFVYIIDNFGNTIETRKIILQ